MIADVIPLHKLLLLLFHISFINTLAFSQQSSLSRAVNYLSEFISSEKFTYLQKSTDDMSLVDSIYIRAFKFERENITETLLALTFSVIPYNEIPIQIPLTGCILYYPLVSHNDSIFNLKNKNLPKDLLFDTPENDFGDKDKLAHFFGSAFLSYNSLFFDLGDVFGYFVEVFEENFKVQSSIDERDLKVNELGRIFGKILRNNPGVLPSSVLILHSVYFFRYSI